jgi:RNA-directed DNA polymerase
MKKPTGQVSVWRVMETSDPNEHLLERVLIRANMSKAWKRVKANAGAPGVDGMAVDQFPAWAKAHWFDIRSRLQASSYQPLPVKRVSIPKPTGGMRPLGIPCVVDRLIQQAIAQVLIPIFDPGFGGLQRTSRGTGAQEGTPPAVGVFHPQAPANLFFIRPKTVGQIESLCLEGA